jgi:hypothetical protein
MECAYCRIKSEGMLDRFGIPEQELEAMCDKHLLELDDRVRARLFERLVPEETLYLTRLTAERVKRNI